MRRALVTAALVASAACGSDERTSPMPAGSLVIRPTRLALGVGISRQLTASVLDESGTPVPGAIVTFTTSDPAVVSVTAEGLVSYVGVGQAEITATSDDLEVIVPCTGLRSGHPLGTTATSAILPGVVEGDAPFGVAVDGDGRFFITQAHAGHVASSFYPVSPLTGFATHDLDGTPTSIALLGGRTALVTPTGPDNDDASVIELSSNRVLAQVALDVAVFSAVTAPDSQTAYLGTNDGRILEFDVASSSVTGSIDLNVEKSRANHLAINQAGTLLYASSFTSGTVSEIDLASGAVARTFFVAGEPQGLAVSPDGTEMYVADESGTGSINIYNLAEATLPDPVTACLHATHGEIKKWRNLFTRQIQFQIRNKANVTMGEIGEFFSDAHEKILVYLVEMKLELFPVILHRHFAGDRTQNFPEM
jgi:DNA-binding beta-propeller fold protein YncE